ncbi:RNA-guided endonuclease InsQ/TnpB family protein [Anaerolactibacter massiliensis]|uniref:RNA-guided endonuclease InsQ/TnpB family protein n=1 Tax=Anaerolactibacter massiliensis TaxID=2044573 RepID=UPI000CF8D8BD|nr:RNA-guided endonuclease TnpB family protein [Anaerolactibacter massiliensis]
MYLTQTNYIRHLPKNQYEAILEMCAYANNLYNVGLYQIRQHFFATHQYLRYEENYHLCKGNENYKLLQAGISQQILRICDRSFKSFFALISKKKSGVYDKQVHIPHYRAKGGKYLLVLSTNAINIRNGYLIIPMSRAFAKQHADLDAIRIPVPERIADKKICEIKILPVLNGKVLKIQYCYEQEAEPQNLNTDNALAIDVGLDNLASCVTTTGTPFIVDGRKLKSINQWYNKQLAHYASIKDHQRIKGFTACMSRITDKRNRQVTDYMHKAARYIVDFCIENDIGTLIVGHNVDQKQSVNMGKSSNQKFVQIPFDQLRTYLKCLCERYGIAYIETEESYTSKASFLDGDDIPVFDAKNPYAGAFSGKRVRRGLYRTKENTLINADINGACNIAKKGKQNLSIEGLCRGLLASPLRIRIA